jgi:hypothetical protein
MLHSAVLRLRGTCVQLKQPRRGPRPRARVLVSFAGDAVSDPAPEVHIFVAAGGATLALTVQPDGGNLPQKVQWLPRESIAMTVSALSAYVLNPHAAMTDLIMRGYHLSRMTAEILQFPRPNRNSW